MKIVTYNIQFGLGRDGHSNLKRIAQAVDGADIIALQEVERNWQHSGNVDQPHLLGQILKNYYWVYGPHFDVDASIRNPDGTVTNNRRQFGNMILSKTPIQSMRLFTLPKSPVNEQHNMTVGMTEAVIDLGSGRAIRVYNAHLSAKSANDRIRQIHTLRSIIKRAPAEGGAWTGVGPPPIWGEDAVAPPMPEDFILLGDFNLLPIGPEYTHLIRADAGECDLVDCWVLAGHGRDEGITFPANPQGQQRIDLTFVAPQMQSRVMDTRIDDKAAGSDHQPYWIELGNAPND